MMAYCQLDHKENFQWNFNKNTKIFIHENASECIVCQMAVILSQRSFILIPLKHSMPQELCTSFALGFVLDEGYFTSNEATMDE